MKIFLILTLFLLVAFSVSGQSNSAKPRAFSTPSTAASPLAVDLNKPIKVSVISEPGQNQGISPYWKDWIDAASKIAGVVGLLLTFISIGIAALLAYGQFKRNAEMRQNELEERKERLDQRKDELDWKKEEARRKDDDVRRGKAELARTVLSEMCKDTYVNDAMSMLDWDERDYDVRTTPGAPTTVESVTERDVWAGLRVAERHFIPKERYIRDCFDHFFGIMKTLEYYISNDLVEQNDVREPFDYFARRMKEDGRWLYEYFINAYHPNAAKFLERFPEWGNCLACDAKAQKGSPCTTCDGMGSYKIPASDRAYFIFDCPPRTERFIVMVTDKEKIQLVRNEILNDKEDLHLTGAIVEGEVNYNSPWAFHLDPSTVDFVDNDFDFSDRINLRVENELGRPREAFARNDVWHSLGARLLTEVPADNFDAEQTWSENNEKLISLGRIAITAGKTPPTC